MQSNLSVDTEPTAEPVTKAQLELALRLDSNSSTEDNYLDELIETARRTLEAWMNRTFVFTTYILYLDCNPAQLPDQRIILPRPPLSSVTSVKYIDTSGDEQTVTGTVYTTDTVAEPGRIVLAFNQTWPTSRDVIQQYYVEYIAGYQSAANVANIPKWIRNIMYLLIGGWYENREAVSPLTIKEVPQSLQSLIWAHRVKVFQ